MAGNAETVRTHTRSRVRVCYQAFGDRVKYWQMINEQNLMVRVNNRMNIYTDDDWKADRMRAQMDYHMFLGHALAVNACHEAGRGRKGGSGRILHLHLSADQQAGGCLGGEDERLVQDQLLPEMHINGEYPGYYMRYLKERNIVPKMEEGDKEILKSARIDYIALNYYRTLCASYLPADESILWVPGYSAATRWILTSTATAGMRKMKT